jgi:hypothetical protein
VRKLPAKYIFTAHSKNRGKEREVTEAEMVDAIEKPDKHFKQYKGNHKGWVYLFHKKHGNRRLSVVAELYKDTCYPITAFWE